MLALMASISNDDADQGSACGGRTFEFFEFPAMSGGGFEKSIAAISASMYFGAVFRVDLTFFPLVFKFVRLRGLFLSGDSDRLCSAESCDDEF